MRVAFHVALVAVGVSVAAGCGSKSPLDQTHAAARATLAAGTARMQWRNGGRTATGVVDFGSNRGLVHYRGGLGDTRDVLLLGDDSWVRVHGGHWQHARERNPLQELVSAPELCAHARSARRTGDGDFAIPGGTVCRVDGGKLVGVARAGVVGYYDFGEPKRIAGVPTT